MKRREILAGVAGLGGWGARSWAEGLPLPSSRRRLREGMGLNVKFLQGAPQRDLGMLKELGVRWVRDGVPWRQVEPRAGRHESGPRAWLDRLAFYKANDIGLVCLLSLQNDVAYPPSDAEPYRQVDPDAFGDHALTMARQLRDMGLRFVLEIGNEPHSGPLHKLLGGDWSGRPPSAWVDHYVRMVRAATDKVKAFDPSIRLLADDDMWIVHYRYLDAGLPKALDGLAVHPYVHQGPEFSSAPVADWMRPYRIADDDQSLGSAVRRLQAQGREHLGHVPQIWFTEWGWRTGQKTAEFNTVPELTQAARLPRSFIVAEAAGVEAVCWYSSHDMPRDAFGLLGPAGVRHPSFDAYLTLSRTLGDAVLQAHVIGAQRPTGGLQGYWFQQDKEPTLVLWNADEVEIAVSLGGPLRAAHGVDGLGRPLTLRESHKDRAELTVGGLPVYLQGFEAPARLADWAAHVG